ncbi:MAG: HAMP domain-containing sensor histidine kinase [Spirochaetales bacterium]|nr:HAMP domain-containing sensor histidine kinase [Spirochaetales bacterium]
MIGINIILSGYKSSKYNEYEKIAISIIEHPDKTSGIVLPGTNPFFVFSENKNLIFSNRGKGRAMRFKEMRPVYLEEKLIGYFHAGDIGFADNRTNRIFLVSIIFLSLFSILLSLVIGYFSARFSANRLSVPIELLRKDLHIIRSLTIVEKRKLNITELDSISSDISETSKILKSQEDYKQQWLKDLSHDLRTPLAGLKSQLEAISDGVLAPSKERLDRMMVEVERLENLALSTTELVEIEAHKTIKKSLIDSNSFIKKLISPYEIEINKKAIELSENIKVESLSGDEDLLLRGLGNIVSNAVKYAGENEKIGIKLYCEESNSIVEISNTGSNISDEQKDLIFTRLYRGDSARAEQGSGLGLSITREIINLHGGEVTVQSSSNEVIFKVTLPK